MLNRLHWFGLVQRIEENRIPKRVLYMNLGTRLRGRPKSRYDIFILFIQSNYMGP
jgi:hypothetical protein